MLGLIQRVASAELTADGRFVGRIGPGLVVYLGVARWDALSDADRLAEKVAHLRLFRDAEGKMNLSVQDVGGAVLAVPNFTLMAATRKGRRPSFVDAGSGPPAKALFERFVAGLAAAGPQVLAGVFGAHMQVPAVADGPVNLLVEIPPDRPEDAAD